MRNAFFKNSIHIKNEMQNRNNKELSKTFDKDYENKASLKLGQYLARLLLNIL